MYIDTEANAAKVVPSDFSTIQQAINAADPGDIIFVKAGTYYENVVVNKSITLVGENKTTTIIDGNYIGNVILITAQNVTITGFTIRNSGSGSIAAGIKVEASYAVIQNNIIKNTSNGIRVYNVGNAKVEGNVIYNCSYAGVMLHWVISETNVIYNEISYCSKYGMDLDGVKNIEVAYNNVSHCSNASVYLSSAEGETENVTIRYNILENSKHGIDLTTRTHDSGRAHVEGNTIRYNDVGFYQTWFDTTAKADENLIFHNNFINNSDQVNLTSPHVIINIWDNGYPSGGNYWSNYNDTDSYSGPYQNETGSDGIWDHPYVIDENNTDNYPFVNALSYSKHDVAVLDVQVSDNEFQAGSQVDIYVTVKNRGDFNESNFDVKVYYDHTLIGTQTVAELAPGETVTLTFDWHTGSVDPGKYVIRAEASPVPDEIIRVNNVFWDGMVNVLPSSGGGACPFVYVWNGSCYVIDNNLLPESEIYSGDVEDYYRLEQTLVPDQGKYQLVIGEFENEHSYFDTIRLLAVDHNADVKVAATSDGEILTYKDPYPPVSAIDDQGNNILESVKEIDEEYYQGYEGSYIELDFGNLNVENRAKLVLRTDQPPVKEPWSIHVQVLNNSNEWTAVATILPRVYWSTQIVDLSDHLPDPNGELKVRLYFTAEHKVDYVGLDISKQAEIEIRQAILVSAIHSTLGDVKDLLLETDQTYAELLPNQQITLKYTLPNNTKQARTLMLYCKGHYHTITEESP
jgi:parallel beta-helix repeat protein